MFADNELIVETKQGKVRGTRNRSNFSKKSYCSFSGIPYAKPPIGKLRFRPPVPSDPWKGIFDATKEGNDCLQYSFYTSGIQGSEDCLYMNIHTPEPPCKIQTLKAVIVNLHHGAFNWGSGSVKAHGSPEYIIHHDVIYVTFNYRLHVFGFLNLGIKECAGNAGLKDALLAMKWIKENIRCFGGDPDNITAFGASSGTLMIHYLLTSQRAKGLFHRAILQGCLGSMEAMSYHENAVEIATDYAQILGCRDASPLKIYKFLIRLSESELLYGMNQIRAKLILGNWGKFYFSPFLPSIELYKDEYCIIPERPRDIADLIEPIPIIYGINEYEAMLMCNARHANAVQTNLPWVIQNNLWQFDLDEHLVTKITEEVQKKYFSEYEPTEFVLRMEKFYAEMWYYDLYPLLLDILAKKLPTPSVYLYQFVFSGELNYQKKIFLPRLTVDTTSFVGACHADDSFYWMGGYLDGTVPAREAKVVQQMGTFFTNFAKTGNPNGEQTNSSFQWKPNSIEEPCYMKFGETLEMKNGKYYEDSIPFWKRIYEYIEDYKLEKKNKS